MLVGRSDEEARLRERIAGLAGGRSFGLLVDGPAGIGKTALLETAVTAAAGTRVLWTTGHEAEAQIAYAGLHDLVTPVLELRDRLAPADAAALGTALALHPPDGAQPEPYAVPAALLALLGAAAEEQPVLVVVDDAHWLDEASRDALLFVVARLDADGVGVLLAARDERQSAVPLPHAGLEHLALGGLADDDARALLDQRAELRSDVADAILRSAAGNPLALRELLRALRPAQRAGREPLPTSPPATRAGVQAMFARQLDALPDTTRRALCIVAAAGHDDEALRRLGLSDSVLAPARDRGLIVTGDGPTSFDHPLLASAAYHGMPSADRRTAHAALAQTTAHPARRAWHLSAAAVGPDEVAAAALEAVARDATARAAHADAAPAAARAAELSADPLDRARRTLLAAGEYAVSGQSERALHLAAAAQADDPAAGVEADRVRAEVAIRDGRAHEAVTLLETGAAQALDAGDRGAAARLLLQASLAHMFTGDMAALIETGERAADHAEQSAPDLAILAALVCGEGHAALAHGARADALLTEAEPLLLSPTPPLELAEVLAMGALCSAWLDRFDRAERVLDTLVTAARAAGAAGRLGYPLTVRAHVAWRRGRWRAASADADEATRLARETEQLGVLAAALPALARAEAGAGRFDAARAAASEALAMADAAGSDAIALWAASALGFCELSAGHAEEAAAALDRAASIAAGPLPQPALTMFAADHVEALVRIGREADARAALTRLEQVAPGAGSSWALAAAARGRLLLADDADIDTHAAQALAHHDGADLPFERARTLLAIGERRRRARRRADAREPLEAAVATFDRLGAAPWAARARAELQATGAPGAPASSTGGAGELSPREIQVARLVAAGQTNREVGSALFVSPKTVEHHLAAIFRKLGLRSRTQLATFMAEEDLA